MPKAAEPTSVLQAQVELGFLNLAERAMQLAHPTSPIVSEVSKALAIAERHRNVETRVVCKTVVEYYTARVELQGKLPRKFGGRWSERTDCFELPNGSAVKVVLEGTR